jgi:hypothetical protein
MTGAFWKSRTGGKAALRPRAARALASTTAPVTPPRHTFGTAVGGVNPVRLAGLDATTDRIHKFGLRFAESGSSTCRLPMRPVLACNPTVTLRCPCR